MLLQRRLATAAGSSSIRLGRSTANCDAPHLLERSWPSKRGIFAMLPYRERGPTCRGLTPTRACVAGSRARSLGAVSAALLLAAPVWAAGGEVYWFGANTTGRGCLDAATASALAATESEGGLLGSRPVVQVSASGGELFGAGGHSLLLAEDGTVFACGHNQFGETGMGTTQGATLVPTPIDAGNLGERTIVQVAAGDFFSLLLADDGTVFAFGSNEHGRTGLGSDTGATLIATAIDPSQLGGRAIEQISAGARHGLLLAGDGSVFAFGHNIVAQTGLGTTTGSTLLATAIDTSQLGGRAMMQVSAGVQHSLLRADDGSVFSFGSNSVGATGQGTAASNTLVATPIDASVLGIRPVSDLSAGAGYSLLVVPESQGGGAAAIGAIALVRALRTRRGLGRRRLRVRAKSKRDGMGTASTRCSGQVLLQTPPSGPAVAATR